MSGALGLILSGVGWGLGWGAYVDGWMEWMDGWMDGWKEDEKQWSVGMGLYQLAVNCYSIRNLINQLTPC
jgi:hypothetical protein